jgi:hypothetical protein
MLMNEFLSLCWIGGGMEVDSVFDAMMMKL